MVKFSKLVRLIPALILAAVLPLQAQEVRRAIPVDPNATETPVPPPQYPAPGYPAVPPPATPFATPPPQPPIAQPPAQQPVFPPPGQQPVIPAPAPNVPIPNGPASVNDTARFLAGLPVSSGSPLAPLTATAVWQQHATVFDKAWAKLDARQFVGLRTWETNYLPEAMQPVPVVFYMFSGPDFLYANAFFPNASTYILAGTEPIGPLPDILHFAGPALDPVLQNLEKSLNSVLSFSFFITKDMKVDLQQENLKGTLPIFYVFLARAGKTITDISFVTVGPDGQPHAASPNEKGKGLTPGVRITYTSAAGGAPQTLYYFTTDLSDDGIRSHPGFMRFCEAQGSGDSLLKSASYLMFEHGFNRVRDFLLNHSNLLVQDDSGIPITAFDPARWSLRFFGSYPGPIDLFKQYYQPELATIYQQSHPGPLSFGIGYRWSPRQSSLIVANRKGTERAPLRTEQPTPPPTPPPAQPSPTPTARRLRF